MIIITTYLNSENWESCGLTWLRKVKSLLVKTEKYKCIIMTNSLKPDAESKIKELGFEFIPYNIKYNDQRDILSWIVENINDSCLLVKPDVVQIDLLNAHFDFAVSDKQVADIYEFVSPIKSLNHRVEAIKKLKHLQDAFVKPNCLFGSRDFWIAYSGFVNLMHDKNFVDYNEPTLFLNLFTALTPVFAHE